MRHTLPSRFHGKCGFSLVEILLAVSLLTIAVVPMMEAFKPALFSAGGEEERAVFTSRARATLNRMASFTFGQLDRIRAVIAMPVDTRSDWEAAFLALGLSGGDAAAEADKEIFAFKGTQYIPSLTMEYHDANGNSATEEVEKGLLQVSVAVEGVQLRTLKAEY